MSTPPRQRPLVLVADDEPALCKVLKMRLEMEGFDVVVAQDGGDAVSQARELLPDLAVVDVMMPVMNGLEVVRELRADPTTSGLPVIILSARKFDREIAAALETGADRYVAKPFDSHELLEEIRALLPTVKAEP